MKQVTRLGGAHLADGQKNVIFQKSDTTFTIQMGVICIVKVVSDLL